MTEAQERVGGAKLTKAQRLWLEWVGSCFDGVQDITDTRTAMPMLKRGLVSYDAFQDCWRITEAGRAAIIKARSES